MPGFGSVTYSFCVRITFAPFPFSENPCATVAIKFPTDTLLPDVFTISPPEIIEFLTAKFPCPSSISLSVNDSLVPSTTTASEVVCGMTTT